MTSLKLTHIGEEILCRMYNSSESVRNYLQEKMTQHLDLSKTNAKTELPLSKCDAYTFDGAHRIDVGIVFEEYDKCMAIECKLGLTRLSVNQFESRFLVECFLSHKNARISGKMISIYERRLPNNLKEHDVIVNKNYKLHDEWFLVLRQDTINSWHNSTPRFDKCIVVSFEDIVTVFGGETSFNRLVKQITDIDYYQSWLQG